jgi:hypothetical protein
MRRATIQSLSLAATLTTILALSGTALAAATYTVKLNVPQYVNLGQTFKVKATGTSSIRSHLEVFVTSKPCAKSAAAETKRASGALINKTVLHRYTSSKAVHANAGTYHVCAYLTPTGHSSTTRAHSSATYYTLVGAY